VQRIEHALRRAVVRARLCDQVHAVRDREAREVAGRLCAQQTS
jgi:hypothetical protein